MIETVTFTVSVSVDDQSGQMGVALEPSDRKLFTTDDMKSFEYTAAEKRSDVDRLVQKWTEKVVLRKIKAMQDSLAGAADRLRQAKETLGGLL
jgi:hypothetical protein